MKKVFLSFMVVLSLLVLVGCRRDVEPDPQDFAEAALKKTLTYFYSDEQSRVAGYNALQINYAFVQAEYDDVIYHMSNNYTKKTELFMMLKLEKANDTLCMRVTSNQLHYQDSLMHIRNMAHEIPCSDFNDGFYAVADYFTDNQIDAINKAPQIPDIRHHLGTFETEVAAFIDIDKIEKDGLVYMILNDYDAARIVGLNAQGEGMHAMNIPDEINGVPVTSMISGLFAVNNTIETVELPKTMRTIPYAAFLGSTLTEIHIPANIEHIEGRALSASNLETITFADENALKNIDGNPFLHSAYMNQMNGLFRVGGFLFGYVGDMPPGTVLEIPDEVTFIQADAFLNETNLSTLTLPASLIAIGESAFRNAGALKSVEIPASVIQIDMFAFLDAENLTSLSFAANGNLKTIGEAAFNGTAIAQLSIPDSVRTIDARAFENTPFLDNQEGMVVIGRFLYRYSGTVPDHTQLTIPGGVEVISHRAFENQTGLTSVVIPSTVTTIEHSAFKNASALNRVTFEEGSHLKTIKDQAFFGTSALKSITLPASLEVIGPAAFAHADGLTTVRFEQESQLKAIHSNAFYEATALSEIELPHGVRTLGTGAFRNNKALEVIYIPATVEIIGFEAFKGCDALTITTAHQTAPIGWHSKWHAGDSPVDWGQ